MVVNTNTTSLCLSTSNTDQWGRLVSRIPIGFCHRCPVDDLSKGRIQDTTPRWCFLIFKRLHCQYCVLEPMMGTVN